MPRGSRLSWWLCEIRSNLPEELGLRTCGPLSSPVLLLPRTFFYTLHFNLPPSSSPSYLTCPSLVKHQWRRSRLELTTRPCSFRNHRVTAIHPYYYGRSHPRDLHRESIFRQHAPRQRNPRGGPSSLRPSISIHPTSVCRQSKHRRIRSRRVCVATIYFKQHRTERRILESAAFRIKDTVVTLPAGLDTAYAKSL